MYVKGIMYNLYTLYNNNVYSTFGCGNAKERRKIKGRKAC